MAIRESPGRTFGSMMCHIEAQLAIDNDATVLQSSKVRVPHSGPLDALLYGGGIRAGIGFRPIVSFTEVRRTTSRFEAI